MPTLTRIIYREAYPAAPTPEPGSGPPASKAELDNCATVVAGEAAGPQLQRDGRALLPLCRMVRTAPRPEDQIAAALREILEPGQVFEIRILQAVTTAYRRPHTVSGYFDDVDAAARAVVTVEEAKGIYFTPNPVNPALLARAENRLRDIHGRESLTSDNDIATRHWLLIDADPVRPADISSTDEEHEAALERVHVIQDTLTAEGWPSPIRADSGNGGHLLFRIDLPVDDGGLVKRGLEALAFRFGDEIVKVDIGVHNPARIWKLYGTMARKGDDTPERPHRLARLLEAPPTLEVVPRLLLESMAASIPTPPNPEPNDGKGTGSFHLDRWIAEHAHDVIGPQPWQNGERWIFRKCPWNPDHTNRSAYIVQFANGAIAAGCHHNGCTDNNWHTLRDTLEPGWRANEPSVSASSGFAAFTPQARSWPADLEPPAFHGLAGEIVRAIAPHTEASPPALLINFLVAYGNCIGSGPHAVAEADRHALNLNAVLVGPTAKGRKGSSMGHNKRLFSEVDADWVADRIVSGLSTGEGLIAAVRDATYKGMEIVESGVADKRLFVVQSEFAAMLKVMSREGNTLSPVVRQAWDGETLHTLTKNSPLKATGAHISILGHITQQELLRNLSETEAGNGFANRFLWICTKRWQELPEGGGAFDYSTLVLRLAKSLERGADLGELRRDDAAKALWADVYHDLSEGKPGLFGSVTARAEAQVLRLSALYATIDTSPVIQVPHLQAALAVWKYSEASARYIFGDATGDPVADRIVEALRQAPDGLSRTELHNLLSRNASVARIDQALGLLLECAMAERHQRQTGGRPVETWMAA